MNHPNRSKTRTAASNPDPEAIKAARHAAGLTQEEAAKLIYVTLRAWQRYEGAETPMHPAHFELFNLKTKAKP